MVTSDSRLFLIKHLCRCFGVETYQKICKTTDATIVRWLSVPELQKNEVNIKKSLIISNQCIIKSINEKVNTRKVLYECIVFCQIVECSDRFIVCGDQYKELREKLTQAALGQNMDIFDEAIQVYRARYCF